jgi:beta-1,2-mannobiose phosphorylase / 1,2-beta-oligomannan phosphorylase
MRVDRYPENPLVTPEMVPPSRPDFEVVCAFNAGVARYKDEVILLLRVAERVKSDEQTARVPVLQCEEDKGCIVIHEFARDNPRYDFHDPRVISTPDQVFLTTISHLRVARSKDGRHFTVDPMPALFPARPYEAFGLEDPRITEIDGAYHIAYKAVSQTGICVGLATTRDFVEFERKGLIFCPENLDVCIFPEKVGGRYVALHRPVPRFLGTLNMWIAYSHDLMHWGDHHFVLGTERGRWDSGRTGGGAIPTRTDRGWLAIYHGATPDDYYCLGAVLLDLDEPHKIIARGKLPIMTPEAPYEREGFVPNVIFSCGALVNGDTVSIYYGAADTVMAGADMSISEILGYLSEP